MPGPLPPACVAPPLDGVPALLPFGAAVAPPNRPVTLLKGEEVPAPPGPPCVRARKAAAGLSTMVTGRPKEGVESRAERAPAPVPAPEDADPALGPPMGLVTVAAARGGEVVLLPIIEAALPLVNMLELIPLRSISW